MKKTYLTIDIDYWSGNHPNKNCVFHQILDLVGPKIKPRFFAEHHWALRQTNALAQSEMTLINVDFHSDLGGFTPIDEENGDVKLCCGTWIDRVNDKKIKFDHFEWWYPRYKGYHCEYGECNGGGLNPFKTKEHLKFNNFKTVKRYAGLPKINHNALIAASIILSEDYNGDPELYERLKKHYLSRRKT